MTNLTVTRVEYAGIEASRKPSETATLTKPLPAREVAQAISDVVARADELAEDLIIVAQVRARMAEDTGERVPLTKFMRQEGFDPADFGLE